MKMKLHIFNQPAMSHLCSLTQVYVVHTKYSKTCVKRPLSKRPQIDFQDQLLLNAGQKYRRMLQGEHSAILWTFIKLPFIIKIFGLSIFEWLFYTGFTVLQDGGTKQAPDTCIFNTFAAIHDKCSLLSWAGYIVNTIWT